MEKAPVERADQTRFAPRQTTRVNDNAASPSVILDTSGPIDTRSASQIQHDTALEYDSMVFLSTIEQLYIRLSDQMMQASLPLALEYLVNVANQVVEFTEKLPFAAARHFTLEAVLTRDRKNFTQLNTQHVSNGRFAFTAFETLHLLHGGLRHPNTFQQLSRDLLRVINICLNICVKAFYAPSMRQQWRTVYSGFLVNLARVMQKLYTPPSNGQRG